MPVEAGDIRQFDREELRARAAPESSDRRCAVGNSVTRTATMPENPRMLSNSGKKNQ